MNETTAAQYETLCLSIIQCIEEHEGQWESTMLRKEGEGPAPEAGRAESSSVGASPDASAGGPDVMSDSAWRPSGAAGHDAVSADASPFYGCYSGGVRTPAELSQGSIGDGDGDGGVVDGVVDGVGDGDSNVDGDGDGDGDDDEDAGAEAEMEELPEGRDPEIDDDVLFQAYVDLQQVIGEQQASTLDLASMEDQWLDEMRKLNDEDGLIRQLRGVLEVYQRGASKTSVDALARCLTSTKDRPNGTSIIPLLDKLKLPVIKEFSCSRRHKLGVQGDACTVCGEEQRYRSVRLSLRAVIEHFMRMPRFAQAVRSGNELLKEATNKGTSVANPAPILRTPWESPRMLRLHESVDMIATRTRCPIALQFFTDGIVPSDKSKGQDMWVVLLKVLNLPPSLSNDFIIPITIVGSRKKPKTLDAYLEQLAADLGEAFEVFDESTGSTVRVDVHLFSSAQDSMGMPLVGSHQSYPGSFACWKCFQKAKRVKKTSARTYQGAVPTYPPGPEPAPLKTDADARLYGGFSAKALPATVGTGVYGYKGLPALARLTDFQGKPYVDLAAVYDICAMHSISNVVERGWNYVLGDGTWDNEEVGKYLASERGTVGGTLARSMGVDFIDSNNLPWVMNKYKKRLEPGDRNAALAVLAGLNAILPTSYHGQPGLFLHTKNKSEDSAEMTYSRNIKASEWKDAAISGMLPVLMAFGGVNPVVVRAFSALFHFLKILTARTVDVQEVTALRDGQHKLFTDLRDVLLLPTEMTISLHYLQHLAAQVLDSGPMPNLWSFPLEGYFAFLKPIAQLNKASPDLTCMHRVATLLGMEALLRNTENVRAAPYDEKDPWSRHPKIVPLLRGQVNGTPCVIDQRFNTGHMEDHKKTLIQAVEDFYSATSFLNQNKVTEVCHAIRHDRVSILNYDRLSIGDLEVQYEGNKRVARSNEWLVLKPPKDCSTLPTLGYVKKIYKVEIRDDSQDQRVIEERLLLHVEEYSLDGVDADLRQYGLERFVHLHRPDSNPTERLIDVSRILQQAILVPDVRTRDKTCPDKDTYTFMQWLVLDKGTLLHIDLKNPFSPSLTIRT